jgi:uncharacterized protein (DUF488 family)
LEAEMRDFSEDRATILTVGYEKCEIDAYVRRLTTANIEVLVDVRERPLSRKKGFSKRALSQAVEAAGIRYVHVQALGDPKPGREAAKAGQYDLFLQIFSNHMQTHEAQDALSELANDTSGMKICLTCFERDHTCCHRSIVAERLATLTGRTIRHLEV